MPNPLFLYVVVQNDDGSINVDTNVPEGVTVARQATQLDVLDASRKITADLDRQVIVDDITRTIAQQQAVSTAEPTPAQRVGQALAQRAAEAAAAEAATQQTVDEVTEDAQKDDPEV